MDSLILDLYLPVMAFLHCFEDRWSLGMVNKQWHDTYSLLLRPYNDKLASEHLGPIMIMEDWKHGRHGPNACMDKRKKWFYDFENDGEVILRRFALSSPTRIHFYSHYNYKKELFRVSQVVGVNGYCWWKISWNGCHAPLPHFQGDIFDQVPRARSVFYRMRGMPIESEEEWRRWLCFDPALARRIYSFPYFVSLRERSDLILENRKKPLF
jgi:hypothetical protein